MKRSVSGVKSKFFKKKGHIIYECSLTVTSMNLGALRAKEKIVTGTTYISTRLVLDIVWDTGDTRVTMDYEQKIWRANG